jgi:hypothetical protein
MALGLLPFKFNIQHVTCTFSLFVYVLVFTQLSFVFVHFLLQVKILLVS